MKLWKALLAAISAAPRAHARASSFLRDPRTVKEKEEVHRQTMGDYVLRSVLDTDVGGGITCQNLLEEKQVEFQIDKVITEDEASSLACLAVSKLYPVCQGCQGYSQVGREVHIPGCVDMNPNECLELAQVIVQEKPDWFKYGYKTTLVPEEFLFIPAGEMSYYKLGLPVSAADKAPEGSKAVVGVAGNCMVHYSWDWCVESNQGGTKCIKLQPWDCSAAAGSGTKCLSSSECCAKIQGLYPKPDINNNELQCYEWVLPVKPLPTAVSPGPTTSTSASSSVSSGGLTGDRLVIHLNDGKVALPAVITDGNHELVHEEKIIVTQNKCFPNDISMYGNNPLTLMAAVKAFEDQDCANEDNCAIGQEWGYPINTWCVEKVTSFDGLFSSFSSSFNEDINGWTTSQVTSMWGTFRYSKAFNQPLNSWDVSSVTNMYGMFSGAHDFNQPLDSWNVSSVTIMKDMFSCGSTHIAYTSVFNQPLNNWDVSSVTNMQEMFNRASAFNQPLNNWKVSSLVNMQQMFLSASAFDQPLNNWDVSSVNTMQEMFQHASVFNQPLNNWNVSKVDRMDNMFQNAEAFNQNLCQWGAYYYIRTDSKYDYMFEHTACPNKGNPTSQNGPWCAASCP